MDRIEHVDIGADELLPPWPAIFDVATATDTSTWVLVGGLMTQVHARNSGITPPRMTRDVDLVVDVAASPGRFSEVGLRLRSLGFEPRVPAARDGRIYRFVRGNDEVDVMVPDHLPRHILPLRFMQRNSFEVLAGAQAVRRRQEFTIAGASASIQIGVPNLVGALVIKGAAHQDDQRDRGRHLDDGATLLSAIKTVGALPVHPLSSNDRRRLRHLLDALSDVDHDSWLLLEDDERARGQLNARRLRIVIDG